MGEISRFGRELRSVHTFSEEGAVVTDASPDDFCRGHDIRACVFPSVHPSHVQARGQSILLRLSFSSGFVFRMVSIPSFACAFVRVCWVGCCNPSTSVRSLPLCTCVFPIHRVLPRMSIHAHPRRCVAMVRCDGAHLLLFGSNRIRRRRRRRLVSSRRRHRSCPSPSSFLSS